MNSTKGWDSSSWQGLSRTKNLHEHFKLVGGRDSLVFENPLSCTHVHQHYERHFLISSTFVRLSVRQDSPVYILCNHT
jgi:hypothetical protein